MAAKILFIQNNYGGGDNSYLSDNFETLFLKVINIKNIIINPV